MTLPARFWDKVDKDGPDGCWLWTGATSRDGYGNFHDPVTSRAHRLAYLDAHGYIRAGLVLDHLCRVPACVNPAHMEPVTRKENSRRGRNANLEKTHCLYGHPFDAENTYLKPRRRGARVWTERRCRACDRANVQLRSYSKLTPSWQR